MRSFHLFTLLFVFVYITAAPPIFAQNDAGGFSGPKTLDGKLGDWGNGAVYNDDYSHLFDNEAQWLDNGVNYGTGLVPPGGDPNAPGGGEEPLFAAVVDPDGVPMPNSFNIVSAMACYVPGYEKGTYFLAIDLAGPTNAKLSESFRNIYLFDNFVITAYPPPFDVDCNDDPDNVDALGSIIGNIEDDDREVYLITLWVAGDYDQGWNFSGSPGDGADYSGPGFPIVLNMEEHEALGKPYKFDAYIPKAYLIDKSADLDLLNVGGKVLAFESSPDALAVGEYDIEVEVREIVDTILPLIDETAAGKPLNENNVAEAFIDFFADSNGDESDEEKVQIGINVPPPPLFVDVEKTVFCGDCDTPPVSHFPGDDYAEAFPGTDVTFYLTITIPKDNPNVGGTDDNGTGFVFGKDLIAETINFEDWELCDEEITVDGVPGIVVIPDFNIDDDEWALKDASNPSKDYLFDPVGDAVGSEIEVIIPFRVKTSSSFFTKGTPVDLTNVIEVRGFTGDDNDPQEPPENDTAEVNILVVDLVVTKEAFAEDANNITYGPASVIDLPSDAAYPVELTYFITAENNSEIDLDGVEITDDMLENLPGAIGVVWGVGGAPPWTVNIAVNDQFETAPVLTLDDFAEAELLAGADQNPGNKNEIFNIVTGTKEFDTADPWCSFPLEDSGTARVKISFQEEIPTLDFYGVLVLILAMSGLLIWRTVRNS